MLLAKIFNGFQLFAVFVKGSILDGRMGSEYVSVKPLKNTSTHEYFSQILQKPTPLQTHPWEGPYNFRAVIFKNTYGRVRLWNHTICSPGFKKCASFSRIIFETYGYTVILNVECTLTWCLERIIRSRNFPGTSWKVTTLKLLENL